LRVLYAGERGSRDKIGLALVLCARTLPIDLAWNCGNSHSATTRRNDSTLVIIFFPWWSHFVFSLVESFFFSLGGVRLSNEARGMNNFSPNLGRFPRLARVHQACTPRGSRPTPWRRSRCTAHRAPLLDLPLFIEGSRLCRRGHSPKLSCPRRWVAAWCNGWERDREEMRPFSNFSDTK